MTKVDAHIFRKFIIDPTLRAIGLYSQSASNLLAGTAVQESKLTYLRQIRGPALGVYQIEPATLADIHQNYLIYRPDIFEPIDILRGGMPKELALIFNFQYATAMARLVYYRRPEPLPDPDDLPGLAKYWKAHYNTELGRGTEQEFITNYKKFITGEQ